MTFESQLPTHMYSYIRTSTQSLAYCHKNKSVATLAVLNVVLRDEIICSNSQYNWVNVRIYIGDCFIYKFYSE